jgi:hypothetical protein
LGWTYSIICVLLTALVAWKTNYFIPKVPDNPPFNNFGEKIGGRKR